MDIEIPQCVQRHFQLARPTVKKILRQITECIAADLAEKYEQAEYPKYCSPCFLVAKPGSNTKTLLVHNRKLNELHK